jgi:hypothetical protein
MVAEPGLNWGSIGFNWGLTGMVRGVNKALRDLYTFIRLP